MVWSLGQVQKNQYTPHQEKKEAQKNLRKNQLSFDAVLSSNKQ